MVGDMRFHKKYVIRTVIIVILLLGIAYFLYRIPREFHKEYQGVYYQIGNPDLSEMVTIRFDGYLTRGLWQEDSFEGTIKVGDQELTRVNLNLYKDSGAVISYIDNRIQDINTYGTLYTKDIREGFTICILQEDENNPGHRSWSGEDGYMISAPAGNRSEALELSNRLMEKILLEDFE